MRARSLSLSLSLSLSVCVCVCVCVCGDYERLLNVDSIVYQRDMDEAEAMVNHIVRKASEVRPEASGSAINHPGSWDFFLSHGQAVAGDQVKMLCFLLRQWGKTVWYDNEMPNRSTVAMEEGVLPTPGIMPMAHDSGHQPSPRWWWCLCPAQQYEQLHS
eukprot:COSAG02_NODE_8051_length_2731_cov_161.441869_3_plen_159_part_00